MRRRRCQMILMLKIYRVTIDMCEYREYYRLEYSGYLYSSPYRMHILSKNRFPGNQKSFIFFWGGGVRGTKGRQRKKNKFFKVIL